MFDFFFKRIVIPEIVLLDCIPVERTSVHIMKIKADKRQPCLIPQKILKLHSH